MPQPRPARPTRLTWGLVLVVSALLGAQAAHAVPQRASPFQNLGIFARALAHVELSYVDEVDQDELIYGAIRGMLATLDPHTSFMDPEEHRILSSDTEGQFGGIGVEIAIEDGWLTVLSVFDRGPADRAGIQPGDRFLTIEDHRARDMRMEEAVRRMRGEPGTQVRVSIRREGEPEALELALTREIIQVRAVDGRVLADRVVYVQVKAFQQHTTRELRKVLDEAAAKTEQAGGIRGVLLDLRDNAGGLLDEAVLMADEFLSEGTIVSTRGRSGKLLHAAEAHRRGTRPQWPMVVLVNGFTASAAEIVAGALRDQGRAVVTGTRTFGKGSVQNIIQLPDGSALKLTVARYFTPKGRSIQAHGVEPDMAVRQLDPDKVNEALARPDQIREESLERHLEAGRSSPSDVRPTVTREQARPGPGPGAEPSAAFADDFQARIAHQALRALITQQSR